MIPDAIRHSDYSTFFHPETLVSGKEDAANNYARGHYTVGKEYLGPILDRLQHLAENCDSLQGTVFFVVSLGFVTIV